MSYVTAATLAAKAGDRPGWGPEGRGGRVRSLCELGPWEDPDSLGILPGSFTPFPSTTRGHRAGPEMELQAALPAETSLEPVLTAACSLGGGVPDVAARVLPGTGAI